MPRRRRTTPRAAGRDALTRRPITLRKAAARRGTAVGAGLATVDLLSVAPRMEKRLIELSVFSMQGGGSAANIMATMAMLGCKTRFFGRVSDDDCGRYALASLRELGVDTSIVSIEKGKISPVSLIHIDEFTRQRKIHFTRGNISPLTLRDLPRRRLLEGASVVCIDGTQPALHAAIAEQARQQGVPVLLNASQLVGGMGELLALADVVIGSERFANELAPSDDLQKSLREMTRIGPRVAVITLGDAGAIGLDGQKLVEQEAIDVFVADTTGAGDAFCGAFAYGMIHSWPLERALPFANAAAGLICRSLGSRSGLPTLEEVLEAMEAG